MLIVVTVTNLVFWNVRMCERVYLAPCNIPGAITLTRGKKVLLYSIMQSPPPPPPPPPATPSAVTVYQTHAEAVVEHAGVGVWVVRVEHLVHAIGQRRHHTQHEANSVSDTMITWAKKGPESLHMNHTSLPGVHATYRSCGDMNHNYMITRRACYVP